MINEQTIPLKDNANRDKRSRLLALKDASGDNIRQASNDAATKVLQCFHNQLRYCLKTVRKDSEVDFSVLK